jgi:hypothetical protein
MSASRRRCRSTNSNRDRETIPLAFGVPSRNETGGRVRIDPAGPRRRGGASLGVMQPAVCRLCVFLGALAVLAMPLPTAADCGSRGGPGYRGPDGKCVGWANIGRVCGNPPSAKCTPEIAHENAPKAAEHGAAIDALRPTRGATALMGAPAATAPPPNALAQCTSIADATARLECFDRAAAKK